MPFVKGKSGNPGGLSSNEVKLRQTIRELAGKHAERAIERLAELMEENEEMSVAISACKEMLDRSVGKTAQAVELTGKDGTDLFPEISINVKPRQN